VTQEQQDAPAAGGRQPAAGDTIVDDRWKLGNGKEGSGQEQTTTNHCALKAAGKQRPAERGKSSKRRREEGLCRRGEDERRGGGLQQQ